MNKPGIEWTPSEAAALNGFLNTPVGQKWLVVLLLRHPVRKISNDNIERAALTGALAAGYEQCMNEIVATRTAGSEPDTGSRGIDMTKD